MASFLPNLLLLFSCFSLLIFTSVATVKTRPQIPIKPNKLVLKVQKDGATNLHVAQIYKRNPPVQFPFVIDLNGRFLSVNCENQYLSSGYNAPVCHSTQCARANPNSQMTCRTCSSSRTRLGCHSNACGLMTTNPVTRQSAMGELAQDVLSIPSTQGSSPGPMVQVPQFLFACAPSNIMQKGLPKNVQGFAGLGHSSISLPYQLASHFGFPAKFAVCLPSAPGQNGVIFFGEGPYLMNRGIDVSRKLTYTPLTIGRQGEYYINVQSIKINNKVVPLNTSLLPYSPKRGVGGTMISTTTPYTILQTSIFRAVTQLLINQLQGVPQVKPMAPFGVCFDAKKFASNKAALTVSSIDLVLDNNRNIWRLYGHNVIVQPSPNVACLGFVDGGLRPQASIVIGALQLEDNLLQFDLTNSRLGFSSSLLSRRTSCSNFNFGKSSTGAEESTESTDEP
ncbi:hypothetical protein ACFX13_010586 [Malus domestica]|uniref:gamma conglutin 1-like n=1 Tax=Malus domestica TaxID=3750 RepID=UPI00397501AF